MANTGGRGGLACHTPALGDMGGKALHIQLWYGEVMPYISKQMTQAKDPKQFGTSSLLVLGEQCWKILRATQKDSPLPHCPLWIICRHNLNCSPCPPPPPGLFYRPLPPARQARRQHFRKHCPRAPMDPRSEIFGWGRRNAETPLNTLIQTAERAETHKICTVDAEGAETLENYLFSTAEAPKRSKINIWRRRLRGNAWKYVYLFTAEGAKTFGNKYLGAPDTEPLRNILILNAFLVLWY